MHFPIIADDDHYVGRQVVWRVLAGLHHPSCSRQVALSFNASVGGRWLALACKPHTPDRLRLAHRTSLSLGELDLLMSTEHPAGPR